MRRRKRLEAVQLISHCRRSCVTHLAAMDGLAQSGHPNRPRRRNVLLFVVARSRLDRYEELRREFEDWRDVRIVLDRREGERRTAERTFVRVDRRRVERRRRLDVAPYFEARLVCVRYR